MEGEGADLEGGGREEQEQDALTEEEHRVGHKQPAAGGAHAAQVVHLRGRSSSSAWLGMLRDCLQPRQAYM